MDHLEPEEFQHLNLLGIYGTAVSLLCSRHRRIFFYIAAVFVLPLSILFFANIHISSLLLSLISSADSATFRARPGSPSEKSLLHRLYEDWFAFVLFKAAYLLTLLVLSLLSTAAVVYSVAAIFSSKDYLSFSVVLSIVPKVWRRLLATFLSAFLVVVAFNSFAFVLFLLDFIFVDTTDAAVPVLFLLALAYISGLVYISLIWHLASVVSVLEDSKGCGAMRKSRELIKGKLWATAAILIKLNLCFLLIETAYRKLVVDGHSIGFIARLLCAVLMLALLCLLMTTALVVQTVVYFVCKAYRHERVMKSRLSDHLETYLGQYAPLAAKDVQMEQFRV